MGFWENGAARGQMFNRYMTPMGQVWKWAFWGSGILGKWVFWENDAARGLIINRFVIPKVQD